MPTLSIVSNWIGAQYRHSPLHLLVFSHAGRRRSPLIPPPPTPPSPPVALENVAAAASAAGAPAPHRLGVQRRRPCSRRRRGPQVHIVAAAARRGASHGLSSFVDRYLPRAWADHRPRPVRPSRSPAGDNEAGSPLPMTLPPSQRPTAHAPHRESVAQIRRARQRVLNAVAQRHIYTMYGRYSSVREAFRRRGWEEKPPPLYGKLQQHQEISGLRQFKPKADKGATREAPPGGGRRGGGRGTARIAVNTLRPLYFSFGKATPPAATATATVMATATATVTTTWARPSRMNITMRTQST